MGVKRSTRAQSQATAEGPNPDKQLSTDKKTEFYQGLKEEIVKGGVGGVIGIQGGTHGEIYHVPQ